MAETATPVKKEKGGAGRVIWRIVLLLVSAVSLYLLAPKLIDMFTSWPKLKTLEPWWVLLALGFEAMSFVSLWELDRIAFRTPSWFTVGTSQLTSNAAGNVIPGGGATASAIAYRMLVQAGIKAGDAVTGIAAVGVATTATVLALPLLAIPALVGAVDAPRKLAAAGWIGLAGFVAVAIVAALAFAWDRPLVLAGRGAAWGLRLIHRDGAASGMPERLLAQRDRLLGAFGDRPWFALAGAVGKDGFDYAALVCCLAAVGARPHPSLVLLAYVAGALLSMIPLTPGGLGFVEAGLTGMLTLAGASGEQAVVATLAYRLVQFWLPLPAGGVAYLLFRRRYGSAASSSSASSTSP
jgi:uncharacterized membrane protein YbhN (UPF0104 family)